MLSFVFVDFSRERSYWMWCGYRFSRSYFSVEVMLFTVPYKRQNRYKAVLFAIEIEMMKAKEVYVSVRYTSFYSE